MWQNSRSLPTSRDKTLGNILVRSGIFGLIEKPVPQITGATARERLVAVDFAQRVHVLLAGLTPGGIGEERIGRDAELSANKGKDFARNHLARRQYTARISQCAKLQGKTEPVFRPAALPDVFQIVVAQRVMLQQRQIVCRQIEHG